jgi:non-homologous end joining protein Ku
MDAAIVDVVAIAGAIIRQRTGQFDPSAYRDRYQEALQQLIEPDHAALSGASRRHSAEHFVPRDINAGSMGVPPA